LVDMCVSSIYLVNRALTVKKCGYRSAIPADGTVRQPDSDPDLKPGFLPSI
jgi:hypothetical protein